MSLHYLLDGYNIIHQIPKLTHLEINQQRLFLVREIEKHRPQGSPKNKVTLIFDGRPGPVEPIQSSVVSIIYSLDESADDRIKRMVEQAKNSKNCIVVTDDRGIQYAIGALGGKICDVKEFLGRLQGKSATNSKSLAPKNISKGQKDKINEELKSIWLKRKNSD